MWCVDWMLLIEFRVVGEVVYDGQEIVGVDLDYWNFDFEMCVLNVLV